MRITRLIAFGFLSISLARSTCHAQDAIAHLKKIEEANSLDSAGKRPFHLKLTFEYFDTDGKSADTGTIEEWWAAPGQSRVVYTAKSLKSSDTTPVDDPNALDPRERYFIGALLAAEVHPLRSDIATGPLIDVAERDKTFGKATLVCVYRTYAKPPLAAGPLSTSCVEKGTDGLRLQLEGAFSSTARNQTGVFHETTVSMALEIALEEKVAITGKVTLLQSFDPGKSEIVLSTAPEPVAKNQTHVDSGVQAGAG